VDLVGGLKVALGELVINIVACGDEGEMRYSGSSEIDELYLNSPYYLAPDGEVGQQAFAVIREAIRKES
jgi:hypothetical protein